MSQVVIYKGIMVEPDERVGDSIRVRTRNAGDAQKAGLPFKELEGGAAIFEGLAPESELVPVNS